MALETVAEKKRFVKDLVGNIEKMILDNMDKVPEEWDGNELRKYIVYKFKEQAYFRPMTKRRLKDFKNDVLVNNL